MKEKLMSFYRQLAEACREAGRAAEEVSVLFATKYLNAGKLESFIDLYAKIYGRTVLIGENRVQAAQEKFEYLKIRRPDLNGKYRKVMIGNLQKNKINKALVLFDEIWGVDSLELVAAIGARSRRRKMPLFLEVNLSGEESKHGISPDEADEVISRAEKIEGVQLKGLMTMAPRTKPVGFYGVNRKQVRQVFRNLKQLAERHYLLASMGMSGDWPEAVAEGSDILRIGSAVFDN